MCRQRILRRAWHVALGAGIVIVCAAALSLRGASGAETPAKEGADPLLPQKQALLQAAQACVAEIEQWERRSVPLTPQLIELKASMVQRLFEAKLMLAETAEKRIAAAEWYVAFRRDMLEAIQSRIRVDATPLDVAQQTYFLREAELRLAELKQAAGRR